jgi:hypothetical protein
MKAKTQIIIGLITAVLYIAHISIFLLSFVFFPPLIFAEVSFDASIFFRPLLFVLIFPSAYIFTLINKKPRAIRIIFLLLCATLIISFVLPHFFKTDPSDDFALLEMYPRIIQFSLPLSFLCGELCFVYHILPSYFLFVCEAYSAICGLVTMFLLWIGIRGLKQTIKEENMSSEERLPKPKANQNQ